jgi:hypothetical protein
MAPKATSGKIPRHPPPMKNISLTTRISGRVLRIYQATLVVTGNVAAGETLLVVVAVDAAGRATTQI